MILVGILALAGAGAGTASAGKVKPTLKLEANGEVLAAGAPIVASSSNFVIATTRGEVSCPDSSLTGTVAVNSSTKDDMSDFPEASFAGESEEGRCTSTFAPPLNEVTVTASSLPWVESFSTKGEATLQPESTVKPSRAMAKAAAKHARAIARAAIKPQGEVILIEVKPLHPPTGSHPAIGCRFYNAVVRGGRFTASGEPLTVTFTRAKMQIYADSGPQCVNSKPSLSATFTFTSGGSPVSAVFN